jgi:hypothetical protein
MSLVAPAGCRPPFISRLMVPSQGAPLTLAGFQHAFLPINVGIILAIILSFVIHETGSRIMHRQRQANSARPPRLDDLTGLRVTKPDYARLRGE